MSLRPMQSIYCYHIYIIICISKCLYVYVYFYIYICIPKRARPVDSVKAFGLLRFIHVFIVVYYASRLVWHLSPYAGAVSNG
jgi:hypothetical protein